MLNAFERTERPARARNIIQLVGKGPYSVYHDCRRLANGSDAESALPALVAGLNQAAIANCEHFAVHAGVVGTSSGVIAMPAVSGGGKSTLTASLVKAGFGYLSDEALVLDDHSAVIPYPKPFALSAWSSKVLGIDSESDERLVMPADLDGQLHEGPDHLTDIVLSSFGHTETSLTALPKSGAVAALIQYSFNHYKAPERAFRLATDIARAVRVSQLEYDDPIKAAEFLAAELG